MKLKRDEGFEKWFDDYFGNSQTEDSPYTYDDVKMAFYAGWGREFRDGENGSQ